MKTGLVSHIQRFSIQDGPGIRSTVFLKGCPLACWWCHNPENLSYKREIWVLESRCMRCGECVRICPQGPGSEEKRKVEAVPATNANCRLCGRCVWICPTGARQWVGREMTVDEVLAEAISDRLFYDESGGGVTFSGGEPLMQPAFLEGLLTASHHYRLHTVLDTCGYAPTDLFLRLAGMADLVLFDLKFVDRERHRRYTGAFNDVILDNLKQLGMSHRRFWVRIPVIPGINDLPEELEAMAALIRGLDRVEQVHLIPYHQTGLAKYKRLNLPALLEDLAPPTSEYLQTLVARLSSLGVTVKGGG